MACDGAKVKASKVIWLQFDIL